MCTESRRRRAGAAAARVSHMTWSCRLGVVVEATTLTRSCRPGVTVFLVEVMNLKLCVSRARHAARREAAAPGTCQFNDL